MRKSTLLYLSNDDWNALMRNTAEMLAMPERICLRPRCHRHRRCCYIVTKSGEPACTDALAPDKRAAFETLFDLVLRIADMLVDPIPARDPDQRALQAEAIEIIRATCRSRPGLGPRFTEWHEKYRSRAPIDHAWSVNVR